MRLLILMLIFFVHLSFGDQSLHDKINTISAQFLGTPYELNALGEGPKGYFDQAPFIRTDAFDCETFVDTVLAMAFATDKTKATDWMRRIRYKNGNVGLIHRNHFMCLDWIPNNQKQGFIKDITTSIAPQNQIQWAIAVVDKAAWYQHFPLKRIHLIKASEQEKIHRLELLKNKTRLLPTQISKIPYIPCAILFDEKDQPNSALFQKIPSSAIINIVRPNWDLTESIGTHLNISHLGFAIWQKNILYFRQASSQKNAVIDVPLIDYLKICQTSPTIKGINIQVVMNPSPLQKPTHH